MAFPNGQQVRSTEATRPPNPELADQHARLAAAVTARFELLRSDRPEGLARPEIDDLLSPGEEAAYEDPASGFPAPVADDVRGRLWDRREVAAWAKGGAARSPGASRGTRAAPATIRTDMGHVRPGGRTPGSSCCLQTWTM
jgi:hypothetical protein